MTKLLNIINLRTQTRSINTILHQEQKSEITLFNKNLPPFQYISKAGSNLIGVDKLPNASNFWLKIPQDKLDAIKEVINYALQGILLFDDVQDNALFRRKIPAAHRIFGTPLTLNSSIYTIGVGCEKAFSLGHPMAPKIYCKNMQDFLDGQGLEIFWRDNYICPTENEFIKMAEKKNGFYYTLQFELMQLFSDNKTDYRDFLLTFGLYYHIRDEYSNLVQVAALEEKSRFQELKDLKDIIFCEDITEGRFTWPILHALKTQEAPTIRNILYLRTRDAKIKQHCLSLLEKVGSLEFTRQTLTDLDRKLRKQAENFGGNPLFVALLDELNTWNSE